MKGSDYMKMPNLMESKQRGKEKVKIIKDDFIIDNDLKKIGQDKSII